MEWIPDWVAIIGSGYIGLEFSDVYTALGSEVTFIEVLLLRLSGLINAYTTVERFCCLVCFTIYREDLLTQAVDNLMPGFDKEIAKMAQRILINPRKIDWRTGVLATKVTPGDSQRGCSTTQGRPVITSESKITRVSY